MHHPPAPPEPKSRLLALIVLAMLPLALLVWLQALESGRLGAILAALLVSCACLLLALLAARAASRLQARLRQAQAALLASDESRVRLGHELRNPVGAISAAVQVLESAGGDSETAAEARSIIARQVRTLSGRIDGLLHSSVAPAGAPTVDPPPLHLGSRVLVVQAEEDLQAAQLRAWLESDGHTVSSAASAPEGLERLLALRPDVSIVDVSLPGAGGFELARAARAAGYAGRIVALSGAGRQQDLATALGAGFDACLVAPLDRLGLRASLTAAEPCVTRCYTQTRPGLPGAIIHEPARQDYTRD